MIIEKLAAQEETEADRLEYWIRRMYERHSVGRVTVTVLPADYAPLRRRLGDRQRPRAYWGATWRQSS